MLSQTANIGNLSQPEILAFGLGAVYWIALGLGGTVLVFSFLLAGLGIGKGEITGHDATVDAGHAGAGHGEGHAESSIGKHAPGIVSPILWSFFLVCFGLVGLLTCQWQFQWGLKSLVPAVGVGLGLSLALRQVVGVIFAGVGGSEPRPGEEVGLTAEVITPIPEAGLGEVAYVLRGMRYSRGARGTTGKRIERGRRVVITAMDGKFCQVVPASSAEEH